MYYTFIVHAHVHAYLRVGPAGPLDLPRLFLSPSLSFGRYRTVPQGGPRALRHLATGCLLLPHTWPGCFLFLVPLLLLLSYGRILSPRVPLFFFYSRVALRRAHDLLHSGNGFAEYNLPLPTPSRAVTCARHVRAFVAYLPQQTFNFFIRRSPFAGPLALIVMPNREDFIVSFNVKQFTFFQME